MRLPSSSNSHDGVLRLVNPAKNEDADAAKATEIKEDSLKHVRRA